jgi:hypothetical protein
MGPGQDRHGAEVLPPHADPAPAASLLALFADHRLTDEDLTVTVPRDWTSWQGKHGGLIAGLAVDAAAAAHPDAVVKSVTAHFSRQLADSPFVFRWNMARGGRVVRTIDVTASQDETPVMTATVTMAADGRDAADPGWYSLPAPPSLPPARCSPYEMDRAFLPVGCHLDIRPCGGCFPLTAATEPYMLAWLSVIPEVVIGPGAAVLLSDLAPGVFPLLTSPVPAPTVELTVHLCADPVLGSQRNSSTAGNWSVDDASLWDSAGRLIAQARQLRRIIGGITRR